MDPTVKSAHKDSALTNIAIGYKNPMFIGDRVFPHVVVSKQSDYFFKFLKAAWFRLDAKVRGPGANAAESGYKLTSDTYNCIEWAIKHKVPIELINNADVPIRPLESGVNWTMKQILLRKEYQVASLCMNAANWTSSNDAEGGWAATADGSGNTFIEDVFAAKKAVRELIGVNPNVMVMDQDTFDNCCREYTVLERIKYSYTGGQPAIVTPTLIAQLFSLDEVLIGEAIYSDSEETVAGSEFNAVKMWETNAGKGSAFLCYRTPTPALDEPNAGYIYEWNGGSQGDQASRIGGDVYRTVRRWYDEKIKSWWVEASEYFDEKVTCADAGYLFYDTIAT